MVKSQPLMKNKAVRGWIIVLVDVQIHISQMVAANANVLVL